jgi:simple sugar transport system ATP-binding protein
VALGKMNAAGTEFEADVKKVQEQIAAGEIEIPTTVEGEAPQVTELADGPRQPGEAAELALELRGITKRFGALTANDAIDFDLRRGEVHALLGENGAGKSTLMNVVYGMLAPDEGQILVDGRPVAPKGPRDAMRAGVGMVFQHFMLIPVMTVAENFVLGAEPTRAGGLLDERSARERLVALSERYGLAVDPDAKVQDISVGQQQRVEILRALDRGAKVLVLDEPTAVLTAQETAELVKVLRTLREGGTSIVFISHKLKEILEISDRVTVLRRGKAVGTVTTADVGEADLARLMVGREVLLRVDKAPTATGRAAARGHRPARARRARPARRRRRLAHRPRRGDRRHRRRRRQRPERARRRDLRPALSRVGVHPRRGREIAGGDPRQALDAGIAHIAEDRQRRGLVLDFTLAENLALRDYRRHTRFGLLDPRRWSTAPAAAQGVRRARRRAGDDGPRAVGRQPAEGGHRPRDRRGAQGPRGRAAHARARRRRDRVRPPPA